MGKRRGRNKNGGQPHRWKCDRLTTGSTRHAGEGRLTLRLRQNRGYCRRCSRPRDPEGMHRCGKRGLATPDFGWGGSANLTCRVDTTLARWRGRLTDTSKIVFTVAGVPPPGLRGRHGCGEAAATPDFGWRGGRLITGPAQHAGEGAKPTPAKSLTSCQLDVPKAPRVRAEARTCSRTCRQPPLDFGWGVADLRSAGSTVAASLERALNRPGQHSAVCSDQSGSLHKRAAPYAPWAMPSDMVTSPVVESIAGNAERA